MPSNPHSRSSALDAAVYWMLILMGLGGLAASTLLPEWSKLQRLRAVAHAHQQNVDAFRKDLEREKDRLEPLQSDPAVIARLARRELNYRHPHDRFVRVDAPASAHASSGVTNPALTGGSQDLAPPADDASDTLQGKAWMAYAIVFTDPRTRDAVTVLSIALLATAAGLFWRTPTQPSGADARR